MVLLGLHSHIIVPHYEGSQDRNSNRAGSWRQELMQRPWRDAAYWLCFPMACSASFLVEPRTTSPRVVPTTAG